MQLETLLGTGYAIMVGSILLMFWVSYSSAGTCHFDPSCECSSTPPQLGNVRCHGSPVYLPMLNTSKLFSLSLINNHLEYFPPHLLLGTGLYKLEISHNPIYSLHDDCLYGLERSLWELHVTECKLSYIPGNALRHLYKLKTLNLTGNEIMEINQEQLKGVSVSLQNLILRNNRLSVLPAGVFSNLQALEHLDLSNNVIATLEPAVFTPPPPRLVRLDLADNMFDMIPYKQLYNIRSLRSLDLSYNNINNMGGGGTGGKLFLDSFRLDYNEMIEISSMAMSNFEIANKTSFRGNPITVLEPNAFRGCSITELILSECHLAEIDPEAFNGLENTLVTLHLEGNNITTFSYPFLNKYPALRALYLDHNYVQDLEWMYQSPDKEKDLPLVHFGLSGRSNKPMNLRKLPRFGHLQTFSFSNTESSSLQMDDFSHFSHELETLRLNDARLSSLGPHLFKHIRGIKTLDLTDNNIDTVDSKTFYELGQSLENLILTHAFGSKMTSFPMNVFQPLSSLRYLKINHNQIVKLPQDISLLFNLHYLYAHDNHIDTVVPGIFKSRVHTKLEEINLSFNHISRVPSHTFEDLQELRILDLSDNMIGHMDPSAFVNMNELKELRLRGNSLKRLTPETFQNLPALVELDFAYNALEDFNFACLDQVGSMAALKVNVSHNQLRQLRVNASYHGKDSIYTSIKVLDFSYNNMTEMSKGFLNPVQHTLTHLYMSYNSLRNASRDMLPDMHHLQYLDLSHNMLMEMEFDSLRSARNLQIVLLSHNQLRHIPNGLFTSLIFLRRLDLSHNGLHTLMDATISPPNLATVDLSYNSLSRAPLSVFTPSAAASLTELNFSHNKVTSLPSADAFSRFSNLRKLDVSNNKLSDLGNSFSMLNKLSNLNLANNFIHIGGKDFAGMEDSLQHLDLSNVSVSFVPSMPLPSLLTLKMPFNFISYLPPDMVTNLTSLKHLDVSFNNLLSVPIFPQLKKLNLRGNPINTISNSSFNEFHHLMDLDLRNLPLSEFPDDSLGSLMILKRIHFSNYKQLQKFNIPQWVRDNKALQQIAVEVYGGVSSIGSEMQGSLPYKVRWIEVTGKETKSVPDYILRGLRFPSVWFVVKNTSIDNVQQGVFNSLHRVRNISLDMVDNNINSLSNPSNTGVINTPRKTYLIEMFLRRNAWTCDCQLGWVETWLRKRRQLNPYEDGKEDTREAVCKNKSYRPLLYILKTELECGWNSGSSISASIFLPIAAAALLAFH